MPGESGEVPVRHLKPRVETNISKDIFKPTGEALDTEGALKHVVQRNEIPPRRTSAFRAAISKARAALGLGSKPE